MVWVVSLLTTDLSTRRLTAPLYIWVFGVCYGLVSLSPLADSVLYPPYTENGTLHLDAFRREPAISVFDWNFSSTHNSSPVFALTVGSGLHLRLGRLHPGHK
jgi:hypothetical protein